MAKSKALKILLISVGDNGGGSWFVADAINKYTEHYARAVRFVQSWINYPYDIIAPSNKEFKALINWASVVHIRDNVSDAWPPIDNKPVVVTWTGMSYRRRASLKTEMCTERGWLSTVSTPDLVSLTPDTPPIWIPNPREDMESNYKSRDFTVCHAPTFRERKGTQSIIEACSRAGIKLELIEETPYIKALHKKARCDVVIDQLGEYAFGYGNNAIEAWAFGIPAISSTCHQRYANVIRYNNDGILPYLECSSEIKDIVAKLEMLRDAPMEYSRYVDLGKEYFYKYHHAPAVAQKAIDVYRMIL